MMVRRKQSFVPLPCAGFSGLNTPQARGPSCSGWTFRLLQFGVGRCSTCLLCLDMHCRGGGLSSRLWVVEQAHAGISLISNKVEHLFAFLSAVEIFSFGSVCIRHFATFCRGIDLQQFLIYPGYNTLSLLCVANTSSPRPRHVFSLSWGYHLRAQSS